MSSDSFNHSICSLKGGRREPAGRLRARLHPGQADSGREAPEGCREAHLYWRMSSKDLALEGLGIVDGKQRKPSRVRMCWARTALYSSRPTVSRMPGRHISPSMTTCFRWESWGGHCLETAGPPGVGPSLASLVPPRINDKETPPAVQVGDKPVSGAGLRTGAGPAHLYGGMVLIHKVALDELDGQGTLPRASGTHHELILCHQSSRDRSTRHCSGLLSHQLRKPHSAPQDDTGHAR